METRRYARSPLPPDRALLEHLKDRKTHQAETMIIRSRQKEAIRTEVTWLLAARFIKEVYHPDWLTNLVLVRKKNNEWRICVDYTKLNKHYPKDPFGVPHIDEVIVLSQRCSWSSVKNQATFIRSNDQYTS